VTASVVDKFVARVNIVHFRKQLAEESDEAKRTMLVRLLAEEEAKLAGLATGPQRGRGQDADATAASV